MGLASSASFPREIAPLTNGLVERTYQTHAESRNQPLLKQELRRVYFGFGNLSTQQMPV
jgi:hypothetical protein